MKLLKKVPGFFSWYGAAQTFMPQFNEADTLQVATQLQINTAAEGKLTFYCRPTLVDGSIHYVLAIPSFRINFKIHSDDTFQLRFGAASWTTTNITAVQDTDYYVEILWAADVKTTVDVYINGNYVAIPTGATTGSGPLWIGGPHSAALGASGDGFEGYIQNVKYYDDEAGTNLVYHWPLYGATDAWWKEASEAATPLFYVAGVLAADLDAYLVPYQALVRGSWAAFIGSDAKVITLGDSVMKTNSVPTTHYGIEDYLIHTGTVYKKAVGGRTLEAIRAAAATEISSYTEATGVIFNGGINDIAGEEGSPTFAPPFSAGLVDEMLADAQEIVSICSPLPCMFISIGPREGAGSWVAEEQAVADEFNARMAIWCNANGVLFVDSQKTLLDPTYPAEDKKTTTYNAVGDAQQYTHLSVVGCETMYTEIEAVALSGAQNADALVASAALANYSALTDAESNAIASFVFRQSRLGNWDSITDVFIHALSDSSDALIGLKGGVATSTYGGTGYTTPAVHTGGEGFALVAGSLTAGSYIQYPYAPTDLTSDYANEGYYIGAMFGNTSWGTSNNTIIGTQTQTGVYNWSLLQRNHANDKVSAAIDTAFDSLSSQNSLPVIAGEMYIASRQDGGSWPAGAYTNELQSANMLATNPIVKSTMSTFGATDENSTNFISNGVKYAAGGLATMTSFTNAMALFGTHTMNPDQVVPTDMRAGVDLIFSKL